MAMSVVYSNFGGRVVSETRGGVESDYLHDPLGSTIGLMNAAGTMTDRWEYWPQGEVVSRTGTNVTPLTFLGVLGYFKDVLDKLFYVRARHLRVDLARWLSVDPLWPAQPAYAYVANKPVGVADPSGEGCAESACAIIYAAACVGIAVTLWFACVSAIVAKVIPWLVGLVDSCLAAAAAPGAVLLCFLGILAVLALVYWLTWACGQALNWALNQCENNYCQCCASLNLDAFGCTHRFHAP